MATLFLQQKDEHGNTVVIPLKVELSGVGRVVNPGDPGWQDKSKELEEGEDHG